MKNTLLISAFILSASSTCFAQEQSFGVGNDDTQMDLRVNPVIESAASFSKDYSEYPFLKLSENHIKMNGADWDSMLLRLPHSILYGPAFSIVHIGDSHIQADAATGVTRTMLQEHFGNAGRGMVTPLKMAGTNEPRDYSITSKTKWQTSKLLKTPWQAPMQFTGVAVSPLSKDFDLSVAMLTKTLRINPFSEIKIYYQGGPLEVRNVESRGDRLFYVPEESDGCLSILLTTSVTDVTLDLHADEKVVIGGISLGNAPNGLYYHSIGNNGATFQSYNNLQDFHRVAELDPDLVILSMGANEAFGKVSDAEFEASISRAIKAISDVRPGTRFLLVTPMECQRRTSSRRSRKKTYAVNQNIRRLRNVILRYGAVNNIPVYDFYAVAGGEGASDKWIADGLMSRDRIHNTWSGYDLQGRLMFDALYEILRPHPQPQF